MAFAKEEMKDMTNISSALVINIGTLTTEFIENALIAGKTANKKNIPIILDAVGAGATKFRTESVHNLLKELQITIIKGNQGEIATIAGVEAEVRGVESIGADKEPKEFAKELSQKINSTVVVTGKIDTIAKKDQLELCDLGDKKLGSFVGSGCLLASVLGSFASINENDFEAAKNAVEFYTKCGEKVAKKSEGAMDFKNKFLDEIEKKMKN